MTASLRTMSTFAFLVVTLFAVSFLTDVQSKRVLSSHPELSVTLTFAQFVAAALTGLLLLRVTRGRPQRLPTNIRAWAPLAPMALVQAMGNLTTTQSFGASAVSFTHTVKASEPLFTAVIARLIMGERLAFSLYLSLLPLIAGVIMVSLTELSFTWFGLLMAVASNACFATRSVLIGHQVARQKKREAERSEIMKEEERQMVATGGKPAAGAVSRPLAELGLDELHLDDVNNFFYVCTFSAVLLFPLFLVTEGSAFAEVVLQQHAAGEYTLLTQLAVTGVGHYVYTLCSLMLLARTSPITHVVVNAMRRVYVIFLSTYLRDGHLRSLNAQNIGGTLLVLVGAAWFGQAQPRGGDSTRYMRFDSDSSLTPFALLLLSPPVSLQLARRVARSSCPCRPAMLERRNNNRSQPRRCNETVNAVDDGDDDLRHAQQARRRLASGTACA